METIPHHCWGAMSDKLHCSQVPISLRGETANVNESELVLLPGGLEFFGFHWGKHSISM